MRETTSKVMIFICPCGLVWSVCVKAGWIETNFTTQIKLTDVGVIQSSRDNPNYFLLHDGKIKAI